MNQNDKLIDEIKKIIDTLRVYVNNDGGDLEFVSYIDNIVTIRILGNCVGCPFIDSTYHDGIKHVILNEFKEIKDVVFIQ